MKRYLAALVAVAIALAASAGSAQALTFRGVCTSGSGHDNTSPTPNGQWITQSPFYIHISDRADRYIAAHSGLESGNGLRITNPVRQMPCLVAGTVAYDAMVAWQHWNGNKGNLVARLRDPGSPSLGRFYCTGQTYDDTGTPISDPANGTTYESCTHTGVHVGTIAVKFEIDPAP